MADLIAIGYQDETTAQAAMDEVYRLSGELIIQPDAVAAIVRGKEGKFKVTTNHHPGGGRRDLGDVLGLAVQGRRAGAAGRPARAAGDRVSAR